MNLIIMENQTLLNKFKKMFKCDTVRLSKPLDTIFLVIGFKKNSTDNINVEYTINGKLYCFDYVEEKCIASGKDLESLLESAKAYKKLLKAEKIE